MSKAGVALIGLGGWGGSQSLESIRTVDAVEIVTWFDASPDVVEKNRGLIPAEPAGSWREVLDNPRVEGVILVVPNHVHAPLAVEAAGRGKHVWVEKPMANTVAECDTMIQACEDAGVVLQIGHSLRRVPVVRMMKRMIEEGKIGEPVMTEGHMSHRGGWKVTREGWRWYNSKCPGGPLNLLGSHLIDTMHYLIGPSAEVTAMTAKKCLPCEIDEITQVIIRFKNSVLGYVGDTYVSPPRTRIAVYGTTGFIETDFDADVLRVFDIDGKCTEIPGEPLDLVADEYREFGECITAGRRPETGGAEGRAVVAVMEAALESARTGRAVKV